MYSLVYLKYHSISISVLNLVGLFYMERSKRDPENWIINRNIRLKKRHSRCNRLYVKYEVGRGVVHSGGWRCRRGRRGSSPAKVQAMAQHALQIRPGEVRECGTYTVFEQLCEVWYEEMMELTRT